MTVLVRRLQSGDEASACLVASRFKSANLPAARATQFLANPANYLLAAEVDGALAGFLMAYLVERIDRAASQLFVYELGVAAQHRRHGVGTALMEHVRKVVHEEGLMEAFVFTSRENDAALALYRKTGGQIEDEHSVLFVYPGGAEVARC